MKHDYISKHANLDELQGQMHLDEGYALGQSLVAQQAAFTRLHSDRDKVMQTNFVVSELIAKKLKPHSERQFVKENLVAAAELLKPDTVQLLHSVTLF